MKNGEINPNIYGRGYDDLKKNEFGIQMESSNF